MVFKTSCYVLFVEKDNIGYYENRNKKKLTLSSTSELISEKIADTFIQISTNSQYVEMSILLIDKGLCETKTSHLSYAEFYKCVYNLSGQFFTAVICILYVHVCILPTNRGFHEAENSLFFLCLKSIRRPLH